MRAPSCELPIVFHDVSYRVRNLPIVQQIDLQLSPGAPTALIGPNGAGKTTLLHLAMGLLRPTLGRITWGGRENGSLGKRAILFQRPTMLRRSAAGNLRYALAKAGVPRGERASRCAALFELVGLTGLDARPARKLSGGEQQRLALARALARDPDVLFLDEPTASLDPAATKAVEDVVRAVTARGIKVVLSTHDLAQARRIAGDIMLMHRGRVVEHSDAGAFFAAPSTEEARRFAAGELLV
jgi:tungstate transport system ATP-binding protein